MGSDVAGEGYARWQDSLQKGSGEPWKDFKQEGDLI